MKCKLETLEEIIESEKPTIILLTETHLQKEENIFSSNKNSYMQQNYEFIRNDRETKGGGVLIAIRKELWNCTLEVERQNEIEESLWVKLDNRRTAIRIGVIYAPQENKTKIENLTKMYDNVNQQISVAQQNGENLLIVGDFNAKIGSDESKGGKLLKKLANKNDLCVANNLAKGKWTRIEGEKKSVIDYVLIDEQNKSKISMEIDEQKRMTPFHISKGKVISTDHCAMVGQIDWVYQEEKKCKSKGVQITPNTIANFKQQTSKTNQSKLRQIVSGKETISKKYEKWEKEVTKIAAKCFTKYTMNKYTKQTKEMKTLMRTQRELNKTIKDDNTNEEAKTRLRMVNVYIEEQINREKQKESSIIAKRIERVGGVNSPDFWKIIKDKKTKGEVRSSMKNSKGEIVESTEEILEVYKNWYECLLKQQPAEGERQKQAEEKVEKTFKLIEDEAQKETTIQISMEELKNAIKTLCSKKAPDIGGFRSEFLIYGGNELRESLLKLLNEILTTRTVPEKWNRLKIKSLYKNKGDKKEMTNQRGIFLTSIVSKTFERILLNRNLLTIDEKMTIYQNGGRKERGTVDNLFTVRAVIDEAKYYGKDLYLFYGDLEKCFDKLWLKDSIIEIWKTGVPSNEVMMLYEINKEAVVKVFTPVGVTDEIEIKEVVRQGSIWGPVMCSLSTEKINSIGQKVITMYGNELIQPLTFMDDMNATGNKSTVENMIANCSQMEEEKKMTFNETKSNYQIISKKRNVMEINGKVKKGTIKRTDKYKYLGDIINEQGDHSDTIKKKEKKVGALKITIAAHGKRAGPIYNQVVLKLYETVARTYITYNAETWSNLSAKEEVELEKIQKNILYYLFKMPVTTPYEAFLSEIGIWSLRSYILYKKLLLLQKLQKSETDRLAKRILDEQINGDHQNCWYSDIKKTADEYKIDINKAKEGTKGEWKTAIKRDINMYEEAKLKERGTKSRFVRNVMRKEYITNLDSNTARNIMKIRLNMIEVKCNFKGKWKANLACPFCKIEQDTTEHVLRCNKLKEIVHDHEMTEEDIKTEEVEKLVMMANYVVESLKLRPE